MSDFSPYQAMKLDQLLPPKLQDLLLGACRTHNYDDGQLVWARGDRTQGLGIVRSGRLNAGNVGVDGSYVVTFVLGPGHVFGGLSMFAGLPTRAYDIMAVGEAAVSHLDKPQFDALTDTEPEILRHLLRAVALRMLAETELLDDALRLPLRVRVAKMLRTFSELTGGSTVLEGRQAVLAQMLGASRVSISKILHELQDIGLISVQRGKIIIEDLRVLDDWITSHSLVGDLDTDAPDY